MRAPSTAIQQYERQQQIAGITASSVSHLWNQVGADFDAGWARVRPRAVETLQLGRAASIHAAVPYTSDVLHQTGQRSAPSGAIVPATFLATAPDGYRVSDTLDLAPIRAKQVVAGGGSITDVRRSMNAWLTGVTLTMLADTRRDVYQTDMVSRPQVTGYVRMLNPPSCDRCAILAGRRYLWNQGFQRHPNCDCQHIPASEQVAGDYRTDPYEYFRSLSDTDQERVFGKYQAQAIRDGADIYRVTNTRMRGLGTATGNRRYGTPYQRTVEDIYTHDRNRDFVIENLTYHGYITGPQTPGGNILGNDPFSRIVDGGRGRGRGTYTVGGVTDVTNRAARYDAVTSGVRDPLNRATMPEAERRLYDAHYRARWADAGYWPNSVGANSADRGLGLRPISFEETARARQTLAREVAGLNDAPQQVRDLAILLGIF